MRRLFFVVMLLAVSLPASAALKTICIDPGHGGSDPGAVGCGLEEATVVLDVGWRLHALITADPDLKPVMTRTTDTYVSLQGRCNYANDKGSTRFASLHCNAFNGVASGIETFSYTNGSATSFDQRDRIQDWMTETWPKLPDRGGKTAGYYVIKNTSMPATLSELAFIDKCSLDATYLADDNALQAAAIAHHQALRESLGLSAKPAEPTDPPVDPPDSGTGVLTGVVFADQGVGTEDMSLRLAGAWVEAAGGNGNYEAVNATAPDGEFMVPLPAGQYKVMVSQNGYYSNERTCSVSTGNTTWCSVGLFKKPGTLPPSLGTLRGIVFEDQGVGSSDTTVRLPGSTILMDNKQGTADQTITAAPDAEWLFEVPPGSYTVTSIHNGHWTNTRVCEVHAGQVTWCSLGMFKQDQGTPPDPPSNGGILLGAVYLADPNGDSDLSTRLPGATVTVEGAGLQYEAMSSEPYGLWSFALPSGTYTVSASMDGHWPNSRTCPVGSGVEVWCSVGLLKDEGGYGSPEDPSTPAIASEDPENIVPTSPEPLGEDPDEPGQPLIIPPEDTQGGGCGTGPASGSSILLLLLLSGGLLALRRPRWFAALLLLALATPLAMADEAPRALIATDLRIVAKGDLAYPLLSPDGRFLAVTNRALDRLSVIELKTKAETEVMQGIRVGYEPRWQADGSLGIRLPHQARHEVPALGRGTGGQQRSAPQHLTPGRWIRLIDDVVYLQTGTSRRQISPAGDKFYSAEMSADGTRILFHGLTTGVYVHSIASGQTDLLAKGTNGRFGPNSSQLVFDRCRDDGDFLTSCQIFLASLRGDEPSLRTVTGLPKLAHQPSLGPDGMLVFEAEGGVFSAVVE
jgi:N-acetylmuramoyl-L-alanine amidase